VSPDVSITICRCIGSFSAPQASSVPHLAALASVDFGWSDGVNRPIGISVPRTSRGRGPAAHKSSATHASTSAKLPSDRCCRRSAVTGGYFGDNQLLSHEAPKASRRDVGLRRFVVSDGTSLLSTRLIMRPRERQLMLWNASGGRQ
jgi:hypothetical protein